MPELLLLNGPNLGRLGRRSPEIYGNRSLDDITREVAAIASESGWSVVAHQHDSEGDLIHVLDRLRDRVAGAIVNPGALMMAGWSLRDALEDFPAPWIEVHISNLWAREAFRHHSILSPIAHGVICGLGPDVYTVAATALIRRVAPSLRNGSHP